MNTKIIHNVLSLVLYVENQKKVVYPIVMSIKMHTLCRIAAGKNHLISSKATLQSASKKVYPYDTAKYVDHLFERFNNS